MSCKCDVVGARPSAPSVTLVTVIGKHSRVSRVVSLMMGQCAAVIFHPHPRAVVRVEAGVATMAAAVFTFVATAPSGAPKLSSATCWSQNVTD